MKKTEVAKYDSSEKHDSEIILLNKIIAMAEKKNPRENTAAFFNLQEMKRRRESIISR